MVMCQTVYDDDNWTIEVVRSDKNPTTIRISSIKDGHFVDDLVLNRQVFEGDKVDRIKDILFE